MRKLILVLITLIGFISCNKDEKELVFTQSEIIQQYTNALINNESNFYVYKIVYQKIVYDSLDHSSYGPIDTIKCNVNDSSIISLKYKSNKNCYLYVGDFKTHNKFFPKDSVDGIWDITKIYDNYSNEAIGIKNNLDFNDIFKNGYGFEFEGYDYHLPPEEIVLYANQNINNYKFCDKNIATFKMRIMIRRNSFESSINHIDYHFIIYCTRDINSWPNN